MSCVGQSTQREGLTSKGHQRDTIHFRASIYFSEATFLSKQTAHEELGKTSLFELVVSLLVLLNLRLLEPPDVRCRIYTNTRTGIHLVTETCACVSTKGSVFAMALQVQNRQTSARDATIS